MQIRTIATVAIAIVLGLGAVFLVQSWLGRQRQTDQRTAAIAGTTPVLVASQPLARGVALSPALVKEVRFPNGSVPPGALTNLAQLNEGGSRLVLRPMAANEPILTDKITGGGGRLNLSAAMTEGMRAVTFRSNDVSGVAGFVLPGDRVDVLLTRQMGEENYTTTTRVLADNVKVLGVDQITDEATAKPTVVKAITIEVAPDQAQLIRLAESVGDVSLALRHVSDTLAGNHRVVTIRELGGYIPASNKGGAGGAPAPAAPREVTPAAPTPYRPMGPLVTVTRGIESKSYEVVR